MENNQEQQQDLQRDYVAERDNYKRQKAELSEIIDLHTRAIRRVENKMRSLRPQTEKGERVCYRCDCVSMIYLGRTPQGGLTGGRDIYECEICLRIE